MSALDTWVENFSGHAFFDMNIITGAKGFPAKAFLRAMDGHIFRFHGEDYNLQALHSEVEKIARLLNSRESGVKNWSEDEPIQ
ncbi:MAG: hypothetical protein HZA21_01755 [Nitrospirae bacterium]|nr:hypothetical protein [Nitrospirota bacterium]